MQKIVPQLWYTKDVEEAARFYASIFPNSSVDRVSSLQADSPSGPPGSVVVVDLTLFGQKMTAFAAGKHHDFNDAVSFMVHCDSQAELDRYWNAIVDHGGKPQACGWIIDRYGVRWQIVPTRFGEMMRDPDQEKVKRATKEMLSQVKLDLAKLEAAFNGK